MSKQEEITEWEVDFLSTQARRVGVDLDAITQIAKLRTDAVCIDPARSLIITPEIVLVMVDNVVSTIHRNPVKGAALIASASALSGDFQ